MTNMSAVSNKDFQTSADKVLKHLMRQTHPRPSKTPKGCHPCKRSDLQPEDEVNTSRIARLGKKLVDLDGQASQLESDGYVGVSQSLLSRSTEASQK